MMRISACLLALALSLSANAGDVDPGPLLGQLESDDFEAREDATRVLSMFPAEYAAIFLGMTQKVPLESAVRLRKIAKTIFMNEVITRDERYMRLYTETGIIYEHFSMFYMFDTDDDRMRYGDGGSGYYGRYDYLDHCDNPPWWRIVTMVAPESAATGTIRELDVITHVDGMPITRFICPSPEGEDSGGFVYGREYKLSIRRYKDVKAIRERGSRISGKDKFEEIEVVIKPEFAVRYDNMEKAERLCSREWVKFVLENLRPQTDQDPKPK
jgi:hypothetical protein